MRHLWLLLAGVFLVSMSIPANAAVANRHCAYRLEPLARHGTVVDARLVRIGCYPSFALALEVGSGGTIRIASTTTPKQLRAADLVPPDPSPAASTLIGTEYVDANYSGSSNSYFASSTCSASTTWQVSYVGASWNDLFSSGRGYGGCNTNKKYQDANFGGSVLTCTPDCSYYGALNDQVSSLRWRP